jgi:hypothetical protein
VRRRIGVPADDPVSFELAREIADAAGEGASSLVRLAAGELLALATGEDIGLLVLSRARADADTAALQRYLCLPGRCVVITGD